MTGSSKAQGLFFFFSGLSLTRDIDTEELEWGRREEGKGCGQPCHVVSGKLQLRPVVNSQPLCLSGACELSPMQETRLE